DRADHGSARGTGRHGCRGRAAGTGGAGAGRPAKGPQHPAAGSTRTRAPAGGRPRGRRAHVPLAGSEAMRLLPPAIDTLQAAYSLEMEHPGSGHRAVETFAAMPAVVARAAELIQAGYTIGIWSPARFEAQCEAKLEGRLNMSDGSDATQEGSPLL